MTRRSVPTYIVDHENQGANWNVDRQLDFVDLRSQIDINPCVVNAGSHPGLLNAKYRKVVCTWRFHEKWARNLWQIDRFSVRPSILSRSWFYFLFAHGNVNVLMFKLSWKEIKHTLLRHWQTFGQFSHYLDTRRTRERTNPSTPGAFPKLQVIFAIRVPLK